MRVGALTVRLNAINAPPLDSRSARSLAYRGQRSSNRINRFVVPRSAKRSTAPGVGRYLESSSTLLFNLSSLTPSANRGMDGEGTNASLIYLKRKNRRDLAMRNDRTFLHVYAHPDISKDATFSRRREIIIFIIFNRCQRFRRNVT